MQEEIIAERESEARMIGYRIQAIRARMAAEAEAENPGKPPDNKKDAKPEAAKPEAPKPEVPKIKDPYLLAKAFMRCGDEIDRIDRRISAGEKKRDGILREIYRRRDSLARRLEKASSDIVDAEFTEEPE
jgi:hypothetical protein